MRCDGEKAYQLAHQLEAAACWRSWLGDQWYAELRQHLGSPAAWATLMRSDASTTPSRLRLQLRINALLYDKALESMLWSSRPPNSAATGLALQANAVYFSLEPDAQDWARLQAERASMLPSIQAKYGLDPRDFVLSHHVAENKVKLQQRRVVPAAPKQGRNFLRTTDQSKSFARGGIRTLMDKDGEELDLWYDQWLDKRLVERMHCLARRFAQQKVAFAERDSFRRTPEGMATFINLSTRSWRRQHDEALLTQEQSGFFEEDLAILPEALLANCVPDNPCPGRRAYDEDSICYVDQASSSARSSTLLPSLSSHGIRKQENGLTASKAVLVKEEADRLTQRTLAKILHTIGFEGANQTAMDVLSELTVCYMRNLGNRLRMLVDSYQKHLTTDEILRMFVRSAKGSLSDLRSLEEYLRSEKAKSNTPQVQQNDQFMSNKMQMNLAYQQVLKEKQLAAARAARLDFSGGPMEMKSFVSTFASKQAWMGQQQQSPLQQSSLQLPHSNPQVLQQLKQALHLQQGSGMSGLTKTRIEGLQEILGSDLVKQEASDDMDGTLGSPNKRKRAKND